MLFVICSINFNSQPREGGWVYAGFSNAAGHDEAGAEIGDSGMTRDMKLYELRMLVLGYMQNEDPKKAAEVFEKWIQEVKEAGDE